MSMLRRNFNEQPNGEKAEHEHVRKAGSPLEGALGPCAKTRKSWCFPCCGRLPGSPHGHAGVPTGCPNRDGPQWPPIDPIGQLLKCFGEISGFFCAGDRPSLYTP